MNIIKTSLQVMVGMLLTACSHTEPYTKTATNVDINRFMISWHVQAGRFTSFEKDPYNSIESYTWNEKEQRIDIDFRYNQGAFNGPLKKIPQTGWIKNTTTNATWSVQPWWPLKFDYLILAVDENYEWTAIGVPDQSYLWIMTKEAQYPREKTEAILEKVRMSGYRVDELVWVSHDKK